MAEKHRSAAQRLTKRALKNPHHIQQHFFCDGHTQEVVLHITKILESVSVFLQGEPVMPSLP